MASAMTKERDEAEMRIPVVEEELVVRKRQREIGRVVVSTIPRERQELVEQELERVDVEIERVPVDRVVEAPPRIREDGDTLVIPVVEEVAVVEKRLVLREEIRVHRRRTVSQFQQPVTLRSEDVVVEREDPSGEPGLIDRSDEGKSDD
jgi:stress response protein YsnF